MRTLLYPLVLLAGAACDGRYILGDVHDGSGGDSNAGSGGSERGGAATGGGDGGSTANGGRILRGGSAGSTTSGGDSGKAGAAQGGSTAGSATGGSSAGASVGGQIEGGSTSGGEASGGAAGDGGTNPGPRWLALQSFVSSSSTRVQLSLVNLDAPSAQPVIIDAQAGHIDAFSPDGRWLLYRSFTSAGAAELSLVDVAGPTPRVHSLELTTSYSAPCRWSPNSERLACIKAGADERSEIVYFETSAWPPSKEQSLGAGTRDLAFLDDDTLVFGTDDGVFAKVRWAAGEPVTATELGAGSGVIVQRSPDGYRALVQSGTGMDAVLALVDFENDEQQLIDEKLDLSISPDFTSAVASGPDPESPTGPSIYTYYLLDGIQLVGVGHGAVEAGRIINPAFRHVGRTVVRLQGERVLVTQITDAGSEDYVVPGDYADVNVVDVDAAGRWLRIASAQRDEQGRVIPASSKQWLSELRDDGPSAARLIGQGYPGQDARFAPNGALLLLADYQPQSATQQAFHVFDLTDPDDIVDRPLDLPLNWSEPAWSADSRYLSILGGAPETGTRQLYVLDVAATSPRLIQECGPSAPAEPTCPSIAVLQPAP